MKNTIIIAFLISITFTGYCQEQVMIWYFGNHSGLDFSSGSPQVLLNNKFRAEAGCASICNNDGNLLFYTNGNKVWNKSHEIMENGDSLNGSQLVNQNSVIVPQPLSDSLYYLFTINDIDSIRGFNYSVIDMSIDGGLGKIIEKNTPIKNNVLEKITAVEHCNGIDYWIIIHGHNGNFYSYLLSDNGFSYDTVKSTVGSIPKADIGYLKVSPAGNSIVLPINTDGILAEVFNFDNSTGIVSQPTKIFAKNENTYCYGIEFSPDGNMLYLNTRGAAYNIWQYNLRKKDEIEFNNNAINIESGNNFAMQLAPNGKIYIASENRNYLNSINKPNESGNECDFEKEAVIFTQSTSLMGLPNFMQTWLYKPSFDVLNTCYLDTTIFIFNHSQNIDSVVWEIYDESNNNYETGNDFSISKVFEKTGSYNIQLTIYHCGIVDTASKTIEIFPYPKSNLTSDTTICNNCTLVLDAGKNMDDYLWNNGSENRYLSVYNSGIYWVEIEKEGCYTIDTTVVSVSKPYLEMPNAFTPNGDGLNDKFMVVNTNDITKFNMWIFNRNGSIVYQNNNINEGWDGTYLGQPSYQQTFVWNIAYSYYNEAGKLVNESKKGTVIVLK